MKNWFSFNEPRVVAALGYDTGFFAPGRCSKPFGNCTEGDSATEPYIVAHNLILCHATAAQRYREKYQVRFSLSLFPTLEIKDLFLTLFSKCNNRRNRRENLAFSWILCGMNL